MNSHRSREMLDVARLRVRHWWAVGRAYLSWRRIGVAFVIVALVSTAALVGEAMARATLTPRDARVPTAFHARPVPWGGTPEAITTAVGVPIGEVGGGPGEERLPVVLSDVPQDLVDAVLAVEDQRFLGHDGLDLRRIGGALLANVRAGGIAEGGSTITQQLAKNLFLTADRTPLRKLREAAMAAVLEARYPKSEILEAYLNEIYLGQDRGRALHGMGVGARYYFGKDVGDLSLAESALLAGMIHAPNRHAPTRNPESAKERRDLVLQLMLAQGRVTLAEAETARGMAVSSRAHSAPGPDARYFRDYVTKLLPRGLPQRGASVYTTLDARLQSAAEEAIREVMRGARLRGVEAALLAIDPRTGEILAMVGGRDYVATQFNRAVDAKRQPGSAFKPIVAVAALEPDSTGVPAFTLASRLDDAPLSVTTPDGIWTPSNYDGSYRGTVTLRRAMEKSLNVPFARVGLVLGPGRLVATAHRLGIISELAPVPSLALGSGELTMLELVRAYGVLAAEGRLAPTRAVLGVSTGGQAVPAAFADSGTQVLDPAVAYLVTSALEGVVSRGTAYGLIARRYRGGLAAKTGTSNDWKDAWLVAYTPELVVGVWVGRDDATPTRLTGATGAMPIVTRFLASALAGRTARFEAPPGIIEASAPAGYEGFYTECDAKEIFLAGTEPPERPCIEMEVQDTTDGGNLGDAIRRGASRLFRKIFGGGNGGERRP
ncbi:MAG: transglycosylase domain-containing protein [Gemmatimonadales bacterium]